MDLDLDIPLPGIKTTMPYRATFRFSWALDAFTFVGLFLHKIILKIIFINALI